MENFRPYIHSHAFLRTYVCTSNLQRKFLLVLQDIAPIGMDMQGREEGARIVDISTIEYSSSVLKMLLIDN